MRKALVFLLLSVGAAWANPPEPPPSLTPQQLRELPKKMAVKPPPYFFKKDGTPYKAPVQNEKITTKLDLLRKRGVPGQAARVAPKPIAPPLQGSFADWISFTHEVIHRR